MKNAFYLVSIFAVAFGLLSYDFYEKNKKLERVVYTSYTNDLMAISEKMNDLRNSVHQSLLYEDEVALQEELSNITRISSEMKQSINELPLDEHTRVEWSNYLSRLGSTAQRAKSDNSIEWHTVMASASTNIDELVNSWQDITYNLYAMNGKVKDWEALAKEPNEDFVEHVNILNTYREADFPLTASESDAEKKRDLQYLMDKELTREEALQKIYKLFPELKGATVTISRNRENAKYEFYHVQFVKGSRIGYVDVTIKGGHLLSFLMERPMGKDVKSHEEIKQSAEQFMKNAGMEDTIYIESRENSTVWHFVYARKVNDIIIYPDAVQVKVAKDTGEILGVNAIEYIQKEQIPQNKITPIDEASFFHSDVEVIEKKLILTSDAQKESRICYEYIVFSKGKEQHTFRLVIDAENHIVQKIERMN